jgi:Flp pilus assembly pilin Flp
VQAPDSSLDDSSSPARWSDSVYPLLSNHLQLTSGGTQVALSNSVKPPTFVVSAPMNAVTERAAESPAKVWTTCALPRRARPAPARASRRRHVVSREVGEMSLRMHAPLLRLLENGETRAVRDDHSQARVDVRAISATNRQDGNESTRCATRALNRFRESHIAAVTNATVHGADWPGPDVSSCQGQTSRREKRAFGSNGVGSFAASDSIESRSTAPAALGAQLVRPLLLREREQFAPQRVRRQALATLPGSRAGGSGAIKQTRAWRVEVKNLIVRFVREDAGQDLIEYAMLATLVALVVGVAATTLGTNLAAWYTAMAAKVTTWSAKAA